MAEAGALDAVLTLDARQLGVMQPRPLATLHVGGAARFDGLITASSGVTVTGTTTLGSLSVTGNITAGSLTVTGNATVGGTLGVTGALTAASLGVTGNTTTGSLTVTNNATVGGTLGVTGALTAGNLNTAGALSVSGASAVNNTLTISAADSGVLSSGTGSFGLMIQPTGGGAARITYHRPGAFAAYMGMDTDNYWKVGGWSMGAVSYRLVHEGLTNPTLVDPSWRGITAFTIPTTNDLTNYMFWYGTGTATLPTPVAGKIRFIKAWGGPVTVNSAGTNLMAPGSNGSVVSSFVLAGGDSLTMISDGSYWWTV